MICNRIKEVRNACGLSQDAFGKEIGITKAAISRIEAGLNNAAEQTILSICRTYNVNEAWLRTGEGSMFNALSREEQAARIVGNAISSDNDFVIKTFIALGQLTPNEWQVVEKLVKSISEK